MDNIFSKLNSINVNEHTEKKNNLTYLSWAWAWAEVKKVYPSATYSIRHFDGKPYLHDENLGYMVMTEMTIDGLTHEMWLPVMDNKNKSMKDHEYEDENWGKKTKVKQATMFDINTSIMRCLTKNIAMFGLGLYIYAGEDLPEEEQPKSEDLQKPASQSKRDTLKLLGEKYGIDMNAWIKKCNVTWQSLTEEQATQMLMTIKQKYEDKK